MRTLLYYLFKIYIKTQFFFYTKKIKKYGLENIPKDGAILFTANHPNGVLDPILIASNIKRKTHFLVQAGVFKNALTAKIFDWLGMIPIYRIRDGIRELAKNNQTFSTCRRLLHDKKVLLIFPEGTHSRKRTIRPLSKGFTRIVFGALDENPNLKISIIPVGITYQNSSVYPSNVALCFGTPIIANDYYNTNNKFEATKKIKEDVKQQLEKLTVHIDTNESFNTINNRLNETIADFTEVNAVNKIIKSKKYPHPIKKNKSFSLLKLVIIINSCIPYFIWKKIDSKITEIEFKDTFRMGINTITFPLFYVLQSSMLSYFFNWKIGLMYFLASLLLVLSFSKTAST